MVPGERRSLRVMALNLTDPRVDVDSQTTRPSGAKVPCSQQGFADDGPRTHTM